MPPFKAQYSREASCKLYEWRYESRQVGSTALHGHGRLFDHPNQQAHLPGQRRRWYNNAVSYDIKLLETVISTANFPGYSVLAGDLGTVVEISTVPRPAYDVEFVNPDGSTRALLTLAPDQVRRLSPVDVMTTRKAPLAA